VSSQKIEQSQSSDGGVRPSEEGISSKSGRVSGTDHQEVEWQFDSADLDSVGDWLGGGHEDLGILIKSGEEKELTDVYYDTEDWKLYRAGYALRVRKLKRRSEATMKSLASATSGDDARRRREISEPLRGEEPSVLLSKQRPGPVGKHLKALVGTRKLRPLFEVCTCRRTFNLFEVQIGADGSVDGGDDASLREVVQDASGNIQRERVGSRIGEVALDKSEIALDDEPVRLARIEVEAEVSGVDAPLGLLEDFAVAMKEEFELRSATASKYEVGLLAKGLDPEGTGGGA
jgi:triphosphatase